MNREFLKFWVGQSVSMLGNQFTLLALPIAAAVTLQANAAQMGVLGAMRFGPGILFGLPAGVWLDRTRRKPALVASQAVSSAALATILAATFRPQDFRRRGRGPGLDVAPAPGARNHVDDRAQQRRRQRHLRRVRPLLRDQSGDHARTAGPDLCRHRGECAPGGATRTPAA